MLMSLLERRLDNVVHRLGFGPVAPRPGRSIAHGHITVNGRRVDVPSYLVRAGRRDPREESTPRAWIWSGPTWLKRQASRDVPDFLSVVEADIPEGIVARLPEGEDVSIPVQTQLIVELCSR